MSKENLSFDYRNFLKNLTSQPGVYRMYDKDKNLLYVGKAKNLQRRVSSYFNKNIEDKRISIMIRQINHIEITVVRSEAEALVLESTFIRNLKPKYNIALKDHKGYPYIHISDDEIPKIQISYNKKEKGLFFGPFPSSKSVRSSIDFLQKYFKLRTCDDVFFSNRSRPCLEYQIGRCTAPCVGLIKREDYKQKVDECILLLKGGGNEIFSQLSAKMQKASQDLDFESAARLRDQITHLRQVQEKIAIETGIDKTDILAVAKNDVNACVCVLSVKDNVISSTRTFKIPLPLPQSKQEVLEHFLAQYLLSSSHPVSKTIIIEENIDNLTTLQDLYLENNKEKITIEVKKKSQRELFAIAKKTAQASLEQMDSKDILMQKRWENLEHITNLSIDNKILECFDISHTQGDDTIASCVSLGLNGPIKKRYKRYNIQNITPGDDYAAMYQVLSRRFKEKKDLPGILVIDGGLGQINQAIKVLEEYNISLPIIGISKGVDRKSGEEELIFSWSGESVKPGIESPALNLLAQIRDEAHRFAIEGHRKKREKRSIRSTLEDIEGIGANKRRSLLISLGGIESVKNASLDQLEKVPGIGKELAKRIFDQLHK